MEESAEPGMSQDVDYEFDCPQYTDFSQENQDEFPQFENEDGFFAMRRSSIGIDKIPEAWLKRLEDEVDSEKKARVSNISLPSPPSKDAKERDYISPSLAENTIEANTNGTSAVLVESTVDVQEQIQSIEKNIKEQSSQTTDIIHDELVNAEALKQHFEENLDLNSDEDSDRPQTPPDEDEGCVAKVLMQQLDKCVPSVEKPVREKFAQAETEAKDEPQNNEPADDIQVDELVIAEKPKKFKRPGTPKNIFRASTKREPQSASRGRTPSYMKDTRSRKERVNHAKTRRARSSSPYRFKSRESPKQNRKSKKTLTEPMSPKFATHSRSRRPLNPKKDLYVRRDIQHPTASGPGPVRVPHIAISKKLELTNPQSVKLATKSRARTSKEHIPSHDEVEKDFMEKLKPFKARPFDRKILQSSGDLGVPRVEKKAATKVHAFQFKTDSRARARRNSSPANLKSTKPRIPKPARLSVDPFKRSMERHSQAKKDLQRKIQREREEEEMKRHFKAKPLPNPNSGFVGINPPPEKPLTQPHTPLVLNRSIRSRELFNHRIKLEEEREKKKHNFVAAGLPRTTFQPGRLPEPNRRKSTQPLDPGLKSDKQAQRRASFDAMLRDKENQQQLEQDYLEKQRKLIEARELREYRKTLVHKPLPLPRRP